MKAIISALHREHLEAATEVLALAFRPDPLMQYLFYDAPLPYNECLSILFRFSCEVRFLLDWPLLGCWSEDHDLAAAAGLDLPGSKEWPPELERIYREMGKQIGVAAVRRMEHFSETADTSRPAAPHIKVGMIGAAPQYQGKGYGVAMMHFIHSFAKAYVGVEGIWLDTENPRNLPWYQLLGYEVRAKSQVDEVTVWGMYQQLLF